MYQVEFLPIAKEDIEEIICYISHRLNNRQAAKELVKNFMEDITNISNFPYNFPTYNSIGVLNNEYRYTKVKNFLIFYNVNEKQKIVTISRVLYQRMDISKVLE